MVCLCPPPPPLLTTHFHFPLELYVYITLTNNYLAFFIYQLIILWTISINWHRWLLVNNHISKYNSFIMVLYWRYIHYVSVCPPPLFGTFLCHCVLLYYKHWVSKVYYTSRHNMCYSEIWEIIYYKRSSTEGKIFILGVNKLIASVCSSLMLKLMTPAHTGEILWGKSVTKDYSHGGTILNVSLH